MKTIVKWLNNLSVLTALSGFGLVVSLVALGRAYDLGKSDWASWVQAVGSIAAIVIAFTLAQSQHVHERGLDQQRRKDEQEGETDRQLLSRTVAVMNVALTLQYSMGAVKHLVNSIRGEYPDWKVERYRVQVGQMRQVLDSFVTSTTEYLAVRAALEMSEILTEVLEYSRQMHGSQREELLAAAQDRINFANYSFALLMKLRNDLVEECRQREIQVDGSAA